MHIVHSTHLPNLPQVSHHHWWHRFQLHAALQRSRGARTPAHGTQLGMPSSTATTRSFVHGHTKNLDQVTNLCHTSWDSKPKQTFTPVWNGAKYAAQFAAIACGLGLTLQSRHDETRTASHMPSQAGRGLLLAGATENEQAVASCDVPGAYMRAPNDPNYRVTMIIIG